MRVVERLIVSAVFVAGLLAMLAVTPTRTAAQCGMMSGGGHDHSSMQAGRAPQPSGSEKKLRKDIDRILSKERGRALLTDALLNDRAFLESLIQRLAANPEWREMAARRLGSPGLSGPAGAEPRVVPNVGAATYVCPMHSDVTSSGPGECTECGMELVRKDSGHD